MEDETNVDSKDGTKRGKAGNDSSFSSFGQDCFQIHQDESTTKTKATGGIETDTRTNGEHEQGQDNYQRQQEEDKTKDRIGDFQQTRTGSATSDSSFSSFGQDCTQIHQDESTTKTKATGGIETDTRTNGDHEQGQDNFQLHQDEDKTKDRIGDFQQGQDGISDFQQG